MILKKNRNLIQSIIIHPQIYVGFIFDIQYYIYQTSKRIHKY
jgi:hypothetical protein